MIFSIWCLELLRAGLSVRIPVRLSVFTFTQGADGVRGLKGSKGEKVSETD